MKTIIEPFRIKSVELLTSRTLEERQALLREAHYNVVRLRSADVLLDLLTDSGTSAMSAAQWSAFMGGDESYVGSPSYYRFIAAVRTLKPFQHVLPTHQGRAAERILAVVAARRGSLVPSNAHFETTRGNFKAVGLAAVDLSSAEENDGPEARSFKGNMDTMRLERLLEASHGDVPLVMMTITNNAVGGQPVSMDNIRRTKEICRRFGKPLFLDACRFAENAYFIKLREPEHRDRSIRAIVQEMFSYADGMTMSAKKDALASTGGWLALDEDEWAAEAMDELLLTEGFVTYGGLTGRDLDAIAVGLEEGLGEAYLAHRHRAIEQLGDALFAAGIPVMRPVGGHAVFIDASAMLAHLPRSAHPGHTLTAALYEKAGIRACEMSSTKLHTSTHEPGQRGGAVVRLAIPRRVYTQSHLEYLVEAMAEVLAEREGIQGLEMIQPASPLSHYAAKFRPIEGGPSEGGA